MATIVTMYGLNGRIASAMFVVEYRVVYKLIAYTLS